MNKQIKFTYNGRDYTLEFTRATIKAMERKGFRYQQLEATPMTMLPELFAGAFLEHHPTVRRDKIDAIYAGMTDKKKLLGALVDMYAEPISALTDDSGNVEWTPNWNPDEEPEEEIIDVE